VSGDSIQGYRFEEPSHAAVAQAVWSGAAEVGLGLESAARDRGLGFVPLFEEDYWIACRDQELVSPGVEKLMAMLAESEWIDRLDAFEGYQRPSPESSALRLSELIA
jgi:molybdate-binding protein